MYVQYDSLNYEYCSHRPEIMAATQDIVTHTYCDSDG